MLPIRLVTSPGQLSAFVDDSGRGTALVYGLPAVLIAIIGVSSLCWAKYGLRPKLEERYKTAAEKSSKEKGKVFKKLQTEVRMMQAANQLEDPNNPMASISDEDERKQLFEELQNRERVYLEKLISLNPDELDYRFRLALVSMDQGDFQRGLALMQKSAPESEPGYAPAHLWLSSYFMGLRTNSAPAAMKYRELALQHAEHCLTRDQNNDSAKLIKARLLYANMRYEQAYRIFDELFDSNPIFYEPLVAINKKLNLEDENRAIYDEAQVRFENKLERKDLGIEGWVRAWKHIITCLVEKHDFQIAEKRLLNEIQVQAGSDDGAKRVFFKQMLAAVYLDWIRWLQPKPPEGKASPQVRMEYEQQYREFVPKELEFLKMAFRYNPSNSNVLRGLARIAISDHSVAEQARQIYDPRQHVDAPASVLNELGSDALAKSQYEDAIRYFEQARKKAPNSSMILNNLAYVYLVCENRNPDRALKLVEEAIRFLPNTEAARKVRSNFYDTKGTALMQLNRMSEALAAFEKAIQDRPNNRKILESLVRCYEGNNLSPEVYLERLRKLDEAESLSPNLQTPIGN